MPWRSKDGLPEGGSWCQQADFLQNHGEVARDLICRESLLWPDSYAYFSWGFPWHGSGCTWAWWQGNHWKSFSWSPLVPPTLRMRPLVSHWHGLWQPEALKKKEMVLPHGAGSMIRLRSCCRRQSCAKIYIAAVGAGQRMGHFPCCNSRNTWPNQ